MLSLGLKFGVFPFSSRACFSIRRRVAFLSGLSPETLFVFAARKKAHKRKLQYSLCENTCFKVRLYTAAIGAKNKKRKPESGKLKKSKIFSS